MYLFPIYFFPFNRAMADKLTTINNNALLDNNNSNNFNNSNNINNNYNNYNYNNNQDDNNNIQNRNHVVLLPPLIDVNHNHNNLITNNINITIKNNSNNIPPNKIPVLTSLQLPHPLMIPSNNISLNSYNTNNNIIENNNNNNNIINNNKINNDNNIHSNINSSYPLNEQHLIPPLNMRSGQMVPPISNNINPNSSLQQQGNNFSPILYPTNNYNNNVGYTDNNQLRNLHAINYNENINNDSNNNIPQFPHITNNNNILINNNNLFQKNLINNNNNFYNNPNLVLTQPNNVINTAINNVTTVTNVNVGGNMNMNVDNTNNININDNKFNITMQTIDEQLRKDSSTKIKHKAKKSNLKQCPICGKNCFRPSSLKIHYLTHTGETPYHCTWENCNKSFNVKSNLGRHLKLHQKNAKDKKVFELP